MVDDADEAFEAAMSTFAANLERAVQAKRMTWAELARQTGTSRAALRSIVVGQRAPTLKTLVKLASALEIEPWRLLKPPRRSGG